MSKQDDRETTCQAFYEHMYKTTAKIQIKSDSHKYYKIIHSLTDDCEEPTIESYMGSTVGEERLQILSEYCSADKLTVPGEIEKRTAHRLTWRKEVFKNEQIPDDVELKTVKEAQNRQKMRKELKIYKYTNETPVHYDKLAFYKCPSASPFKDVLVFVRVYNPFRISNATKLVKRSGRICLNNVVALHGKQRLTDLRDKIACLADYSVLKDVSDDPKQCDGPSAKEVYPSAFFYIEDTFYNDNRYVSSCDNSEIIRQWAKERNHGPFQVASMEETKIEDLSVRFGFPWVYQHQGRCEHVIVFSDARLFGYDDELTLSVYPRIVRTKNHSVRYCMTCGVYSARWITVENDRIPHNPCYFCDSCFKSYNYIDDKKLGNFKAYSYPCDKELLKLINKSNSPIKNKKQTVKK